jgi:putative membrane protein
MKTRHYLLLAAGAVAMTLGACNKPADPATNSDQDMTAVNAAQDATSTAVGSAAAPMAGMTTDGFVTNATIANMYEIEAAKMALQRSKTAKVKEVAQKILDDHTKAGEEMKAAAAGMTMPTALDERRQGMIDNLKGAADADFDRVYLDQQNAAHMEAVTLFGTYADHGDNAALKAFATKTKPALEMHLQMVKDAQGGM